MYECSLFNKFDLAQKCVNMSVLCLEPVSTGNNCRKKNDLKVKLGKTTNTY